MAPGHVDAVPDTALGSGLAGRLPLYWLVFAAVLAVGNALIPIWLAGSRLTGAARDGVQFNLLTLAIALALSAGIGVIWPRWWIRAMAILAVGPWPILLITSNNVAAGIATPLLTFFDSWLGGNSRPGCSVNSTTQIAGPR